MQAAKKMIAIIDQDTGYVWGVGETRRDAWASADEWARTTGREMRSCEVVEYCTETHEARCSGGYVRILPIP